MRVQIENRISSLQTKNEHNKVVQSNALPVDKKDFAKKNLEFVDVVVFFVLP